MPLRWTQSVGAGDLLPESTSTMVKLQCMSSWNGFPVIPDTYARVLSNSEMHRRRTVFQSKNKQKKIWTFAVLDLILLINTRSFRSEKRTKTMSVVFPIATLPSVLSCIAEVPHRHPPYIFEVNFFLFYMVSQVIPNSSFLHLLLHLLTHNTTSFCFTVFHWVHCANRYANLPSHVHVWCKL